MKLRQYFPPHRIPQPFYGAGEIAIRALAELIIAILRRYGWL